MLGRQLRPSAGPLPGPGADPPRRGGLQGVHYGGFALPGPPRLLGPVGRRVGGLPGVVHPLGREAQRGLDREPGSLLGVGNQAAHHRRLARHAGPGRSRPLRQSGECAALGGQIEVLHVARSLGGLLREGWLVSGRRPARPFLGQLGRQPRPPFSPCVPPRARSRFGAPGARRTPRTVTPGAGAASPTMGGAVSNQKAQRGPPVF
mmetsp:Transcript_50256/g.114059  ORF Transcript_50256/g.114059 Transcript_50256/m.114059 type:complete len:205 (-) Transcript_50256:116-730(-)